MQTKWLGVMVVSALAGGYSLNATAAPPDAADVPLTLSGCVVAGEAKDSYLLTNVVVDGTTLTPANAFYRFTTTKGLKENVGRRVEVKGKADLGDVDTGKVRVRAEDGKIRTEVTSERRTVKAEEQMFGSLGSMTLDAEVPTYKFDVENVRLLQGNCASAATAR